MKSLLGSHIHRRLSKVTFSPLLTGNELPRGSGDGIIDATRGTLTSNGSVTEADGVYFRVNEGYETAVKGREDRIPPITAKRNLIRGDNPLSGHRPLTPGTPRQKRD